VQRIPFEGSVGGAGATTLLDDVEALLDVAVRGLSMASNRHVNQRSAVFANPMKWRFNVTKATGNPTRVCANCGDVVEFPLLCWCEDVTVTGEVIVPTFTPPSIHIMDCTKLLSECRICSDHFGLLPGGDGR
jgi:hypothetical protein